MKTTRLAILFVSLSLLLPRVFGAESETGIVRGQISNQNTGQFLEGVAVDVAGTAISTVSERGGGYSLKLPAGTYTLVMAYTGLNTERVSVQVAAGRTTVTNVALTSDYYKLEPVTVTGFREGNALAIQLQRQADNVKTVVATDAFGAPAVNPGELLQRLPGVSVEMQSGEVRNILIRGMSSDFASLMIDGNELANSEGSVNHRVMNISQIGTNNLESVELIKAPTADMDANAIGGYVNVRTKRAFDRAPGRIINVSAGTRWTKFRNSNIRGKDKPELDTFTLSYSDVYSVLGSKNNLGLFFTTGYRNSPLLMDEVGTFHTAAITNHFLQPTPTNGLTSPVQRQFGTGTFFWPETRNINVGLNIDYKIGPNTYAYVKNTFNDVDNTSGNSGLTRFVITSNSATAAGYAPGSNYLVSEMLPHNGTIARMISGHQRKELTSYAIASGFEHKMPASNSVLNFDVNYSYADSGYPVLSQVTAWMNNVGFRLDRTKGTDEFHPAFTQTAGPSIYDPANWSFALPGQRNFRQVYEIPAEIAGVRADYRKHFSVFGVPSYIKVGGKMKQEMRRYKNVPEYFTYIGPKGIGDYVAPQHTEGDGLYGPFPYQQGFFSGLDGDPMKEHPEYFTYSSWDAYYNAYYKDAQALFTSLREKVAAAYAFGSIQFRTLRIVPGVRMERTMNAAKGHKVNASVKAGTNYVASLPNDVNADRARRSVLPLEMNTARYTKLFPSLHTIYEPWERLLIRASYNKSITRPPVLTLVPSSNTINEDAQIVTISNPELKPYMSDNFEFAIQKYFEPVGSFEVGVFLKEITDYYRVMESIIPDGPDNGFDGMYSGYRLRQYRNVGGARYRGFEFNYTQQFSFLPGFWRGFGLSANYTYTQAEGDFGGTTYLKQLAGIRPRFGNIMLSYIGNGMDIRLLANYQGKYYRGGAGATTLWGNSQLMLDLKTQYRLNKNYQLYFEVANLLDENINTYVQEGGLPLYAQKQGTLFSAGVRGTF